LKVFLITRPPELAGALQPATAAKPPAGFRVLASAVTRIYAEGGLLAFWTGNGLSVAKIFPESAIKFFAYESSVSATFYMLFSLSSAFHRNGLLPNTGTVSKIPEILAVLVVSCPEGWVVSAVN
jgi:hypothetical protein